MKKVYEEISDEELVALTDAIKTKYGIDFTNYELKSLKRGFGRLITKNNFSTLLELWSNIIRSKEFMLGCIDDLTVNLTELFRNPQIWNEIYKIVNERFSKNSKIKFWHAGCSTGEEIYSTAIVLKQGKLLDKSKSLATDLSPVVIKKAQKGSYSSILENKYRKGLSKYDSNVVFEDYFNVSDSEFTVKPFLKQHIIFQEHNLVTDGMVQKFDVIFCRNVMIYFDEVLKLKVLEMFYNALNDNGILIIGFYDSMPTESKMLFKSIDSKSKIYEKVKNVNDPLIKNEISKMKTARERLQQFLTKDKV